MKKKLPSKPDSPARWEETEQMFVARVRASTALVKRLRTQHRTASRQLRAEKFTLEAIQRIRKL